MDSEQTATAASVSMRPVLWGSVTSAIAYVQLDTQALIEQVKQVDPEHPAILELEKVSEVLTLVSGVLMSEIGSDYYKTNRDDFTSVAGLIGSVRDIRMRLSAA